MLEAAPAQNPGAKGLEALGEFEIQVSVLLVPAEHLAWRTMRMNAATVWPEPSSLGWQGGRRRVWSQVQGQVCVTAWGLCDLEVKAGQDRKKGSTWSTSVCCALVPGQAVGWGSRVPSLLGCVNLGRGPVCGSQVPGPRAVNVQQAWP